MWVGESRGWDRGHFGRWNLARTDSMVQPSSVLVIFQIQVKILEDEKNGLGVQTIQFLDLLVHQSMSPKRGVPLKLSHTPKCEECPQVSAGCPKLEKNAGQFPHFLTHAAESTVPSSKNRPWRIVWSVDMLWIVSWTPADRAGSYWGIIPWTLVSLWPALPLKLSPCKNRMLQELLGF